jgi:hypothetical protein
VGNDRSALPKGWKPTSDSFADNTIGHSYEYWLLTPSENFVKNMGEADKALLLERLRYLKDVGMLLEPSIDEYREYGLRTWIPDATEYEMRSIAANDPAIKANMGFHIRYHQRMQQGPRRRPIVRDETGKEVSW